VSLAGLDMETIQASRFKARCLALMDEVARTGRVLVITKNGRPIAELRAHRPPRSASLIGLHRGRTRATGDVVSPLGSADWEAVR
jgi:antitoxin (DNA-binding transcriptional repressor) of toxin-antitoxin stability system